MAEARSLDARTAEAPAVRLIVTGRELELLRLVPLRIRAALTGPSASAKVIDRLFPKTHVDPELEREHRRLLGETLLERRLELLVLYGQILDKGTRRPISYRIDLNSGEIDVLLHVLNDLRLILGTELGISSNGWWEEGPSDPAHLADFHFLGYLSSVEEEVLAALGGGASS